MVIASLRRDSRQAFCGRVSGEVYEHTIPQGTPLSLINHPDSLALGGDATIVATTDGM